MLLALQRRNKIEAIKLLRLRTGLGLKETKDEIDRIVRSQAGVYIPRKSAPAAERLRGLIVLAAAMALVLYGCYVFLSG